VRRCVSIPTRCELTAGGWDRESLQITWRAEGGIFALSSTDPGATTELGRLPHFQAALDAASRARKGTRRSGRLGLALLALITALPLLAVLVVLAFRDPIIDFVLERIPVSVDREVGKMFEGEILGSKEAVAENEATRAINLMVGRLKAASPEKRFEFKVSVQTNAQVNAFAAPGGLIVVYTGLKIKEAGSAEEGGGGAGPRDGPRHEPALDAAADLRGRCAAPWPACSSATPTPRHCSRTWASSRN
jgi:hypothetical protein